MATMTQTSALDALERALDRARVHPLPRGGFTLNDFMARAKEERGITINRGQAMQLLKPQCEAGILRRQKFTFNGRSRWLFWEVPDGTGGPGEGQD